MGILRASPKNAYISQKRDGRFVIGATSEPRQSDLQVKLQAIDELRLHAEGWLPTLKGTEIRESWAGLRPGTPDNQPMLGAGALPGVFVALGLYRNGVLLAPAVGEMMAAAILDGVSLGCPSEFAADTLPISVNAKLAADLKTARMQFESAL